MQKLIESFDQCDIKTQHEFLSGLFNDPHIDVNKVLKESSVLKNVWGLRNIIDSNNFSELYFCETYDEAVKLFSQSNNFRSDVDDDYSDIDPHYTIVIDNDLEKCVLCGKKVEYPMICRHRTSSLNGDCYLRIAEYLLKSHINEISKLNIQN